jgi:hypothetical protein
MVAADISVKLVPCPACKYAYVDDALRCSMCDGQGDVAPEIALAYTNEDNRAKKESLLRITMAIGVMVAGALFWFLVFLPWQCTLCQ